MALTTEDLEKQSRAELRETESQVRQELFDLSFKHGTRQLNDTASIRRTKRELARVLTIARKKELEEKKAASA